MTSRPSLAGPPSAREGASSVSGLCVHARTLHDRSLRYQTMVIGPLVASRWVLLLAISRIS